MHYIKNLKEFFFLKKMNNSSNLTFKNFTGISNQNFIDSNLTFSYKDEILFINNNNSTVNITPVFITQVVNNNVG